MHHSNLPPRVFKKEGFTIRNEDEIDTRRRAESLDLENEENKLVSEVLIDLLNGCSTIHLDADNPQTLREIKQVTEEIRDIITFYTV